jgi:Tfp pilus assembly protein PilF
MAKRSRQNSAGSAKSNRPADGSLWSSVFHLGSTHQRLCFAVVSGIWVLLLYWNAIGAPFVYDDLDQIVNNQALGSWHSSFVQFGLSPVSFTNNFRGVGGSTYRPIYWLSLFIDRQIWGAGGAAGFHFTNLLIHWANGFLFFVLLRRIRVSWIIAATGALIWLGLPINSEAVAWVSSRAYLLCGLFLLLSLLAAETYLRDGRRLALVGFIAGSLGALLSNEGGLLLLPLVLLLAYATDRMSRRLWAGLVSAAVGSGCFYLALKHYVGSRGANGAPSLWAVGLTFWKYVQWMFAPIYMSVERSSTTPSNVISAATLGGWAGLIVLCLGIFLARKRMPVMAGGLAWGCVALLPFCGVVFLYQGMAERFDYLASAGFALAVAALVLDSSQRWKGVVVGVMIVWMAWGGWRVRSRVLDWGDPVRLYQSSLEATPNSPMLLYNLGTVFQQRGDRSGAIKAYSDAMAMRPDDTRILINLAVVSGESGDKQGAERLLRRAIALAPNQSNAYNDLGGLLVEEGRVDEAMQCFQSAIENTPSDPNPYFNLAVLLQQIGQDDVALVYYKKVLKLKPDDPDTILNISKLHFKR